MPGGGRFLVVGAALVAASVAVSCARPPDDKVRKVRTAFSELRDVVKADQWAHEEMASATSAMEAAEKELSLQNGRFSFNQDFTRTGLLFAEAEIDIDLAKQAALAQKAALEKSARDGLEAALAAVDHARTTLMIAPVSRDSRPAVERLEADLGKAEQSLSDVRRMIVDEKYREAELRAGQVLDQVTILLRSVGRTLRK